jgi:hypothetical protein
VKRHLKEYNCMNKSIQLALSQIDYEHDARYRVPGFCALWEVIRPTPEQLKPTANDRVACCRGGNASNPEYLKLTVNYRVRTLGDM